MANKGTYIYLDRGILDHWTYKDKPFNKSMAWIDLLLIADHTTHISIWRGKPTEFKRGDVNLSIKELARRWGWSRDRARRFISSLEQDGMVRVVCTPKRTVITLIKYEDFQDKRTADKAGNKAPKRTPSKSADKAYLSNYKGIDKEYKESDPPPSDEVAVAEEEEDVGMTDEEWENWGEVFTP